MTKSLILVVGGACAVIAIALVFPIPSPPLVMVLCVVIGVLFGFGTRAPSCPLPPRQGGGLAVGVGVVRTVAGAGSRCTLTIEVEAPAGPRGVWFTGRLGGNGDDPVLTALRPGMVLLVAFDPVVREQLSLADDMLAVHSALDAIPLQRGLDTAEHLDLVHRGIKSFGVVTAIRTRAAVGDDYREVELDLMVSRPEGGQFPAHQRAVIAATSAPRVRPGCIVEAYYRRDDETAVAVCVPPC